MGVTILAPLGLSHVYTDMSIVAGLSNECLLFFSPSLPFGEFEQFVFTPASQLNKILVRPPHN